MVEWFSFAGVQIRIQPDPVPPRPQAPPSPPAVNLPLEKARTMVEFAPLVPAALGLPERVEVRGDRHSLALTWTRADGGSTRLEQFDGRLDYSFAKTAQGVEWTQVNDASALWFEQPHELVLMDAAGNRRTETARTAGRTLIWEQDGTVLRLESDLSLEQAVAIAGTAR